MKLQSAMDENRNLGVREHFDGFAAEDDCRNAAASVRGHLNEVTALNSSSIDDGLVRMFMLDVDGLACNPRRFCRVGDSAEYFRSVLLNMLLILVERVFDNQWVERDDMKWRRDRQHCNFGADLLGKGDAVTDSISSKFGAVCRYQYILVHRLPPPSIVDFSFRGVGRPREKRRSNFDLRLISIRHGCVGCALP